MQNSFFLYDYAEPIWELEAVDHWTKDLQSSDSSLLKQALSGLQAASRWKIGRMLLLKSNAMPWLIHVAASSNLQACAYALEALSWLGYEEHVRRTFLQQHIQLWIQQLKSPIPLAQASAACILQHLATDQQVSQTIVRMGAIEPLIATLATPSRGVQLCALQALTVLFTHLAHSISLEHAVRPIVHLLWSHSFRIQQMAVASLLLLFERGHRLDPAIESDAVAALLRNIEATSAAAAAADAGALPEETYCIFIVPLMWLMEKASPGSAAPATQEKLISAILQSGGMRLLVNLQKSVLPVWQTIGAYALQMVMRQSIHVATGDVPYLLGQLNSDKESVGRAAGAALRRGLRDQQNEATFWLEDGLTAILEALKARHQLIREAALDIVLTLAERKKNLVRLAKAVIPVLLPLLAHEDWPEVNILGGVIALVPLSRTFEALEIIMQAADGLEVLAQLMTRSFSTCQGLLALVLICNNLAWLSPA